MPDTLKRRIREKEGHVNRVQCEVPSPFSIRRLVLFYLCIFIILRESNKRRQQQQENSLHSLAIDILEACMSIQRRWSAPDHFDHKGLSKRVGDAKQHEKERSKRFKQNNTLSYNTRSKMCARKIEGVIDEQDWNARTSRET